MHTHVLKQEEHAPEASSKRPKVRTSSKPSLSPRKPFSQRSLRQTDRGFRMTAICPWGQPDQGPRARSGRHRAPGSHRTDAHRDLYSRLAHQSPPEAQAPQATRSLWKPCRKPARSRCNSILGRLNNDPDALTKTRRLIDSYSDRKARALSATFVQHGTWQCPTLIRDATMRLGDDPLYTQSPHLRYVDATRRAFWDSVATMSRKRSQPRAAKPSGNWANSNSSSPESLKSVASR